jgi:predicted kinase
MEKEPHKWACVSWDAIRHESPNYKFSKANEKRVIERAYFAAREAVEDGYNLLIDNTNLHAGHIRYWTEFAEGFGMTVEMKLFDVPVDECVRRDALRVGKYNQGGTQVGRVVIERMALANGMIKFDPAKKIVIVDVDGTLSDTGHRRKPKENGKVDWAYFYRDDLILADPPFSVVVDWVRGLYETHVVVIVSGRDAGSSAFSTVEWLAKNNVPYHHIFMRNAGDRRDDTLVKQDILNLLPRDRVAFTIDDRDRVVAMWRKNGLTCYQVADGDF